MSMRGSLASLLVTPFFFTACASTSSSPLPAAAWERDATKVAALLSQGESPDGRDADGRTALMNASGAPGLGIELDSTGQMRSKRIRVQVDLPMIRLLLQHGAALDLRDESGQTALFFASYAGSAEAVSTLLAAGANPNAGRGPLLIAASEDHLDVVKRLLAAGADPKVTDEVGQTALMTAAFGGNVGILQELLRSGVPIDATTKDGNTALSNAAYEGQLEAVKALVAAGASLDLRSAKGQTALAVAQERGHAVVADFLRSSGAHE